jgi:hypothetical protein
MSTALETRQETVDLGRSVRLSTTGLTMADSVTEGEWEVIGQKLQFNHNRAQWWLADWMWEGDYRFGNVYDAAEQITGYDRAYLQNLASVSGRFSRRRENLSFGHHQAVAAFDEAQRERWLDLAEAERWSREQLREAIRASRQLPSRPAPVVEQLRLTVEPDRAERWKAAAERAGSEFSDWARDVLDQAAA